MHIEVFGAVIVRKLFARFDTSLRENVNSFVTNIYFAVWPAGMVDKTRLIFFNIPVDHRLFTRPEEVLPLIRFYFSWGSWPADILNNARASRYRLFSKHPEASARALHT